MQLAECMFISGLFKYVIRDCREDLKWSLKKNGKRIVLFNF